jgi:hypothetical protein
MLAVTLLVPESRTPREMLFAFGAGFLVGLSFVAPIAGALAFRAALRPWLNLHGFAVQRCAAFLMAFSLGYLFASVRHLSADAYIGLALLGVFLGVMAKLVCAIACGQADDPPSSRGGGPRPPDAPVPRPPSGGPPALSAAARVEYEEAA